jgi:hypothetical protein
MNSIARVISAVNMPVSVDRMSLTAIRMRARQLGEFSVFIEDSPEAATLGAGDWIAVNRIRSDKVINAFELCDTPRTLMSNAAAPADVSNSVDTMIRAMPDPLRARIPGYTNEDWLAAFNAMDEARRELQFSRHDGMLPDELLIQLFQERGLPILGILTAYLASRASCR